MGTVYLEGERTPVQSLTAHYRLTGVGAATRRFHSEYPERRDTLVDDVEVIRKLVDAGELTANPPEGTATNVLETVTLVRPFVLTSSPKYPGDPMYRESVQEEYARMFRSDVDKAHNEGKVVVIVDSPSVTSQLSALADMVPFVGESRVVYKALTDPLPGFLPSQDAALSDAALHTGVFMGGPFLLGIAGKTIGRLVNIAGRTFARGRSGVLEPVTNIRGRPNVVGQADDALEGVTSSGRIDSMTTPRRLLPDEGQAFNRFEAPQLRVVHHPLYGPQLIEERVTYPFVGGEMSARFLPQGVTMRTASTRGGPWYPPDWTRTNLPPWETPGLRPELYPAWRTQARGGGFGGSGPGGGGATFRTQGGTLLDSRGNIILEAPHPTSVEANQIRLANLETGVGPHAQYSTAPVGTFTGAALPESGLYLPDGVVGTEGVNPFADTATETEPSPETTRTTDTITGTEKALDTRKEGGPLSEEPSVPWFARAIKTTPKSDTDTSSGTGAAQDTDRETATDTGTDTAAETATDTDTATGTKTKTETETETETETDTVLGTPPDPGITMIGDVLETPAEVQMLPPVRTLQQVQLLPEQSLPEVLTLPPALTLQQLEPIQQVTPVDVPEVTPAEEVTPEVFPTGAPPVTQAAETPLEVPLRTPPGGKPPPKKKKRRRLPRIGLDLDDPSLQPSTGETYPRLLRHTETVEVTTDLDTGLSHVELLKTVSPPRVVGRDSDPPVVRPRFSGQQRITAQGRIVRSQPVKKRRKNVHRKLHPYAQFRRDIRRAQRRSGGRQA